MRPSPTVRISIDDRPQVMVAEFPGAVLVIVDAGHVVVQLDLSVGRAHAMGRLLGDAANDVKVMDALEGLGGEASVIQLTKAMGGRPYGRELESRLANLEKLGQVLLTERATGGRPARIVARRFPDEEAQS